MGRPAGLIAPILPDLLRADLRLVICGSAAGTRSAREGAYYAHPGNRFWPTLHVAGLTPRRLRPDEYPLLLDLGIGLTDVCKHEFGADSELSKTAYDAAAVRDKIRRYRPRAMAFNGLNPARAVLGKSVRHGRQGEALGDTTVFVLPSTSGLASRHWDERPWHELGEFLRRV